MAFFGLFDYSKPGPGISKDAPKKRGFIEFWEIFFRKFWKLCTANLLYVLVNLPVVTGGLGDAGPVQCWAYLHHPQFHTGKAGVFAVRLFCRYQEKLEAGLPHGNYQHPADVVHCL